MDRGGKPFRYSSKRSHRGPTGSRSFSAGSPSTSSPSRRRTCAKLSGSAALTSRARPRRCGASRLLLRTRTRTRTRTQRPEMLDSARKEERFESYTAHHSTPFFLPADSSKTLSRKGLRSLRLSSPDGTKRSFWIGDTDTTRQAQDSFPGGGSSPVGDNQIRRGLLGAERRHARDEDLHRDPPGNA